MKKTLVILVLNVVAVNLMSQHEITSTATPEVGSYFQGGILIYLMQPEDPGYVNGEIHGIVVSTFDISLSSRWGCYGNKVNHTKGTMFSGETNTKKIVEKCSIERTAASICSDLSLNGFNDWYLPSYDELNLLFLNRELISNFEGAYYWSSTEYDADNAWIYNFSTGLPLVYEKDLNISVRAIRTF